MHFNNKIAETAPITKVKKFLSDKGFVPRSMNSFKRTMKSLWFDFTAASRGKLTLSGFEHVLLGKSRTVK